MNDNMDEKRVNSFKWQIRGIIALLPLFAGIGTYWLRQVETAQIKRDAEIASINLKIESVSDALRATSQANKERLVALETKAAVSEARFIEIMSELRRMNDKLDRLVERK